MYSRLVVRVITLICTLLFCPLTLWASGTHVLLATTFPVYQMTRNIILGQDSVTLGLMLPAELGCPHDYALTPADMVKIAEANVLITNGLGLEEFLGTPVLTANPSINIINATSGIGNLIVFDENPEPGRQPHDLNPHLFASPRMAAQMVLNIEKALSELYPQNRSLFSTNAKTYALKLNHLSFEVESAGQHLANRRIVTQHGIFDYLARDMGLDIVAVIQAHAGQEPSASDMLGILNTIREKKAAAIFTEPQYPGKIAQTLSEESGIPLAMIDPVATGPKNASLDYYETVMKQNIKTLEKTLGIRDGDQHDSK